MIKAIVFDFDGVLADSEPLHLRAYQEVLSPLGITLSREEYYSRYLGYDDDGVFTHLAEAHGFTLDAARLESLIAEKGRAFDATIASGGVLYAGATACAARMAGAFPLGIASGALRHEIEAILRGGGMSQYFRFIVASGDTAESKPAPGIKVALVAIVVVLSKELTVNANVNFGSGIIRFRFDRCQTSRVFQEPRMSIRPLHKNCRQCYDRNVAGGCRQRANAEASSELTKGQRSTSEIPVSARALTLTSMEDAAASSNGLSGTIS